MKICFYLPSANDPSALLCGYEQLLFLANKGLIELKTITHASNIPDEYLDADAVLFARTGSKCEVELAKHLREMGKSLFYILDDDLLNVPDYIPCSAHFNNRNTKKNMTEIMALCQTLVTPSLQIAEKYGHYFDNIVTIEEPALRIYKHTSSNEQVRIGFAGSADRTLDIDRFLSEPLQIIKEKYGERVSIEFLGVKPAIANKLNFKCISRTNSYKEYQDTMKQLNWDIGLAPMPDSQFHACKHYNKFVEYGSYGIISVCSNRLPYTRIIESGKNGFLCDDSTSAWVDVLSQLIDSEAYRKSIRVNVESQIEEQFNIETVSCAFFNEIQTLIEKTEAVPSLNLLTNIKLKFLNNTLVRKLFQYGAKLPLVAAKKVYEKAKK